MPASDVPLISVLPLATPTLPPATHTNCYFVGRERVFVVEPATYDANDRTRLFDALDRVQADGRTIAGVILTHHHVDHVGSAALVRDRLGVPVIAHATTRELLRGVVEVDELIDEGSSIDLGLGDRASVLFTPGHAPGHIVLFIERSGEMIAGDMVAGIGTILIDPDEGDMGRYISELSRLASFSPKVLMPAHGPAVEPAVERLEGYVAHRGMREAKVLMALEQLGASTSFELLPLAYSDAPSTLYPIAERSCLAHLLKLVREGRVEAKGGRFSLAG
ncbi:MAG: MBL fold metallo-hydrolase [Deltaproteobacteria bacterium]|nr:MBL fold metallo-hydrolase [Deltaproteobacteria bacterium]